MSNYYYLMSSLPSLSNFSQNNIPITKEALLNAIDGFVSKKAYKIIDGILNGKSVKCKYLCEYNKAKSEIDETVLTLRSQRLGLNQDKYKSTHMVDKKVWELATSIVYDLNPLQAEFAIIEYYSNRASNLSAFDKFNFKELVCYALKLRLLLNTETFDKDKGSDEFNKIIDSLKVCQEELI